MVQRRRSISDSDANPTPTPTPSSTTGPAAHWKLDETTGTIASDSSGSNPATLVGGPVWTSGRIGNALQFDGIDDYADAGNSASLNPTAALTLSGLCPKIQS